MATKHIITIDYVPYAVESATAAAQLLTQLAKLKRVTRNTDAEDPGDWFYEEDKGARQLEVSLKLNQRFLAAKPVKTSKPLALPKPKRGSILCICEKSHVAPRESCPHCGRPFAESHGRTHGDAVETKPQLRLL